MSERRKRRDRSPHVDVIVEEERLIQSMASVLHRAMEERRLDKAALADLLGVSRPNVTQLLRGDKNLSVRTIARIAFVLGIRIVVDSEGLARPA